MEVVVSIPDKFLPDSPPGEDISRTMLEAFAIENYRQEKLSLGGLAELLGFSTDEANEFLTMHRVALNFDFEDLEEDLKAVESFIQK